MTTDYKSALDEMLKLEKYYADNRMAQEDIDDLHAAWSAFTLGNFSAIRAALQQAAEMQWQPIETAPRDGTEILSHGGILYWRNDACGGGWYTITGINYPGRCVAWEVTHWMPLPKPPEPAAEKEGV